MDAVGVLCHPAEVLCAPCPTPSKLSMRWTRSCSEASSAKLLRSLAGVTAKLAVDSWERVAAKLAVDFSARWAVANRQHCSTLSRRLFTDAVASTMAASQTSRPSAVLAQATLSDFR